MIRSNTARLLAVRAITVIAFATVVANRSQAGVLFVDFENTPPLPTGPSITNSQTAEQDITLPGEVTFSGGTILGNPSNSPAMAFATPPNVYFTDWAPRTLQDQITIDIDPGFRVNKIDGLLLNGTGTTTYHVDAYNGSTLVDAVTFANVPSSDLSGHVDFSVSAIEISQARIFSDNPSWDFAIDSVSIYPVPEPAAGLLAIIGACGLLLLRPPVYPARRY